MPYYLYILASGRRGTLYIGVTNDLVRRVYEHRTDAMPGFTKKYKVHRLVYYEIYDSIEAAIAQEKRMKRWTRAWKIELIEKQMRIGTIFGQRWELGLMIGGEIFCAVTPAERVAREPGPIYHRIQRLWKGGSRVSPCSPGMTAGGLGDGQ